jgi:predicted amidohydrolase YtcJ
MYNMKHIVMLSTIILSLVSCRGMKQNADLIIFNTHIQTVDEHLTWVQAMAVRGGKIIGTGTNEYIFQHFQSDKVEDMKDKYIYPGFIDSHCHFYGYTRTTKTMADLFEIPSEQDMIAKLKQFRQDNPMSWLVGRGWDQNKWESRELPDKKLIDKEFPGIPVVLIRVDGHALLANEVAIRQLDLTESNLGNTTEALMVNGKFTGIFFETIADRFKDAIPKPEMEKMSKFMMEAEKDCFSVGLTSVADAGLSKSVIQLIDSLQKEGRIKIRIYAMLDPSQENIDYFVKRGVYQTPKLDVRSIKLYADGALGSRGACLLESYSDAPGTRGIVVTKPGEIKKFCELAYRYGYQMNTHCIGDSANRMVLNIYKDFLKGKNDRRWRIEHAQVVTPEDFDMFGKYSIIPAIQATHATSDMTWAVDRLGAERIKNAYAYQKLLQQNGWIPNGTDFPIEKINPLLSFYAAVARMDVNGKPEGGFQIENALTREQALRSLTIWAARGCREDDRKGSLEAGKYADFVVLDSDLLSIPLSAIPTLKVRETYLDGELVYQSR